MNKLLVANDFVGVVPFTLNMKAAELSVYTTKAQLDDFKDILPPALYSAIMAIIVGAYEVWAGDTEYETDNYVYITDSEGLTVLYKSLTDNIDSEPSDDNTDWQRIVLYDVWRDYLKPYLIWKTFSRMLFFHGFNITQFGISQIKEDDTEPISDKVRAQQLDYANNESQSKWFDFMRYMNDVNFVIDSATYSFSTARNEKKPASKIRAVCLIPLLLISFLGFSQYYPLDYNVDFKQNINVEGSIGQNTFFPLGDLDIEGEDIYFPNLPGSGDVVKWASGYLTLGTVVSGDVTGLNEYEVLFGASDGSIDQDAEATYNPTTDLFQVISDESDAGFAVFSSDFSLFSSMKTSGFGVQGLTHASDLTSDEIAAYRAVHQFVQITPNPASWDGYTNITGGNGDDVINWVLPAAQGSSNTFFKNDGNGNLSWATISEYSTETAQDDISAMFTTDNGDIDYTYNDGTPDIAAQIKSGVIMNADINGSAAIDYSKLNLSGSIVNADINSSAAIAYSKLNLTGSILNADLSGSIDATKINTGVVSNTEFNYLDGVTSAIQTQINNAPSFVGTPVHLTGQAAAIGATSLYTTTADGFYTITVQLAVTTTGGTSIGCQIKFTNQADNLEKTMPSNNSNGLNQCSSASTTNAICYTITAYCKTGTAIKYVTNLSGSGQQYSLDAFVIYNH